MNAAAATTSFSYLRVIGDFCGNMIEVEFYGQTWAEATGKAPAAAPQNLALAVDDVERKRNDGAWETVSTVTGTEYTDASITRPTKGTYTYRIASID